MDSNISLEQIKDMINITLSDNYISDILKICIENSSYVSFGADMHKLFDVDPNNITTKQNKDIGKLLATVFLISNRNGISTGSLLNSVKSIPDTYVFSSKYLNKIEELPNSIHYLSVNPSSDKLLIETNNILVALVNAQIPFRVIIPLSYNSGDMEAIKVVTSSKYLEKTLSILNDVVLKNIDDFKDESTFGIKLSDKISYGSLTIKDGFYLTQKQLIGICYYNGLMDSIKTLIDANPELVININGEDKQVNQLTLSDETLMPIVVGFYAIMGDGFLSFAVTKISNYLDNEGINLSRFFVSQEAFNSLLTDEKTNEFGGFYFETEPVIFTTQNIIDTEKVEETKTPLDETNTDLINENITSDNIDSSNITSPNLEDYLTVISKEKLYSIYTLENQEKISLVSLLDRYNALEVVPFDSIVTLNEGQQISGSQFWATYGEYITRFNSLDDFINMYASNITKSHTKDGKSKRGLSSLFKRS